MELDKTAHGENINDVLSKTESVAVFTDGSALGNPGPTGSGAVIYYHGLEQEPVCLSKHFCFSGNNYIGARINIQIALQHISEQEEFHLKGHSFVYRLPASNCTSLRFKHLGIK